MFSNDDDGQQGVMVLSLSDLFGQHANGLRVNTYHTHEEGHDRAKHIGEPTLPLEFVHMVELPRNVTEAHIKTALEDIPMQGPALKVEINRPQTQDPEGDFCPDVNRAITDQFVEYLPLPLAVKDSDLSVKIDETAGTMTVRCVVSDETRQAIEARRQQMMDLLKQQREAMGVKRTLN